MQQIKQQKTFKHYLPPELIGDGQPVEILLIGAGGNGGPMVSGLARMNHALKALGHRGLAVTVMDSDTVGPENVGRQLFSVSDIGRNKAEVAVTRVNHFFGIEWTALPFDFDKSHIEEISKSDVKIVITAVDKVAPRLLVHRAVKGQGIYHLDMGNAKKIGQCILGTGSYIRQPNNLGECIGHLPTVIDLFPNLEKEEQKTYQGPSCGIAAALEKQDLFINTAVSTNALSLLWDAFRQGYLREHGIFVNLETKRTSPLMINPDVWQTMGWNPASSLQKPPRKVIKLPARKAA